MVMQTRSQSAAAAAAASESVSAFDNNMPDHLILRNRAFRKWLWMYCVEAPRLSECVVEQVRDHLQENHYRHEGHRRITYIMQEMGLLPRWAAFKDAIVATIAGEGRSVDGLPPRVLADIVERCRRMPMVVANSRVRIALRELGLSSHVGYAVHIANAINGAYTPAMSRVQYDEVCRRFAAVQLAMISTAASDRNHSVNWVLFTRKACQMAGWETLALGFPILKHYDVMTKADAWLGAACALMQEAAVERLCGHNWIYPVTTEEEKKSFHNIRYKNPCQYWPTGTYTHNW